MLPPSISHLSPWVWRQGNYGNSPTAKKPQPIMFHKRADATWTLCRFPFLHLPVIHHIPSSHISSFYRPIPRSPKLSLLLVLHLIFVLSLSTCHQTTPLSLAGAKHAGTQPHNLSTNKPPSTPPLNLPLNLPPPSLPHHKHHNHLHVSPIPISQPPP